MSGSVARCRQSYVVQKKPNLKCTAGEIRRAGFIGVIECFAGMEIMKARKMDTVWEMVYPRNIVCGEKDICPCKRLPDLAQCDVSVPGYGHPHVLMTGNYLYELCINMF